MHTTTEYQIYLLQCVLRLGKKNIKITLFPSYISTNLRILNEKYNLINWPSARFPEAYIFSCNKNIFKRLNLTMCQETSERDP